MECGWRHLNPMTGMGVKTVTTLVGKRINATGSVWTALLLLRAALYSLIWWLITEGQHGSWFIGVPVIGLATAFSYVLVPPSPRSLQAILHFIPFFIVHSLRGGIDVAWRAFHPRLPIEPILVDYPLRLANVQAQVFMANTTSLLPGTLSARLEGGRLQVHVLDGRGNFKAELHALEQRVATLFHITLKAENDGNV